MDSSSKPTSRPRVTDSASGASEPVRKTARAKKLRNNLMRRKQAARKSAGKPA